MHCIMAKCCIAQTANPLTAVPLSPLSQTTLTQVSFTLYSPLRSLCSAVAHLRVGATSGMQKAEWSQPREECIPHSHGIGPRLHERVHAQEVFARRFALDLDVRAHHL